MNQPNLFGFQSQSFDPYAGLNEHTKLKKMVTKANVHLLLEKNKGFMKQKSLKGKTKVMISSAGENVNKAYEQPFTTATNTNGKISSIAVNSGEIQPILNNIDLSKHQEFVNDSMSISYGLLANKKAADSFFISSLSEEKEELVVDSSGNRIRKDIPAKISKTYKNVALSLRSIISASVTQGGLPDMNKYIKGEDIKQSTLLGELVSSVTKGTKASSKEVQNIIDIMSTSKKTQSAANGIMDLVNKLVEEDTKNGNVSMNSDEELLSSHHPLVPMYNIIKSTDGLDKDKNSSNSAEVGGGELNNNPEEDLIGMNPRDKRFEQTQDTIEFDEQTKGKHDFFREPRARIGENIDSNAMEKLADELYESLKGRIGRLANVVPSKRLSKRNIASGLTDKIYMSTTEEKGKHLNVNIIIDTSGSMSGKYIRDAKEVVYVMNILSERGIFNGNIILSGSRAHAIIPMPMPRDKINKIYAGAGGEGIREAFRKFKPEMKEADFNICLTDGMLTDGYIDKDKLTRQNVSITGAYVTGTKDTILDFTGSLSRWFHFSAVRPTTRELVLYLVSQGLLHTKGN